MANEGAQIYQLAEELFPICRSITGNGTRETLKRLKREIPELTLHEISSGTQVFDWSVPKEWNIREAYIEYEDGSRIVDFKDSNLHVVGYSAPVDKIVDLEELQRYIYSIPDQPDWIPYVTSYYKERSGFCMSHKQRLSLRDGKYHIYIDSDLTDGSLTYGEIILEGKTEQEIFLSTNICHPSLANNELSGPCLLIALAKWLSQTKQRRFTYRIVFVPETIGSISYLAKNISNMKKNIVAGFTLSCVGDNRTYSYLASRQGNTLSDRVAKNVLHFMHPDFISYSFLDRGSDERQYDSPGVDLPVCSVMRSKYGMYPEYHTSADNMSLISPEGLQGAFDVYTAMLTSLEKNYIYKVNCLCEPQLGKRGLYPTESYKGSADVIKSMMDFITYADGTHDLIEISDIINVPINEIIPFAEKLAEHGLISSIEESGLKQQN